MVTAWWLGNLSGTVLGLEMGHWVAGSLLHGCGYCDDRALEADCKREEGAVRGGRKGENPSRYPYRTLFGPSRQARVSAAVFMVEARKSCAHYCRLAARIPEQPELVESDNRVFGARNVEAGTAYRRVIRADNLTSSSSQDRVMSYCQR